MFVQTHTIGRSLKLACYLYGIIFILIDIKGCEIWKPVRETLFNCS